MDTLTRNMPSKKQYNLVPNDEYDTRIPMHPEEAFEHGITFHAKVSVARRRRSSCTYPLCYAHVCVCVCVVYRRYLFIIIILLFRGVRTVTFVLHTDARIGRHNCSGHQKPGSTYRNHRPKLLDRFSFIRQLHSSPDGGGNKINARTIVLGTGLDRARKHLQKVMCGSVSYWTTRVRARARVTKPL